METELLEAEIQKFSIIIGRVLDITHTHTIVLLTNKTGFGFMLVER